MATKILLMGLNRISTSLGLCFKKGSDLVVCSGFDPEIAVSKAALKLGAVDQITESMSDGVKWADVILYALPSGKMLEVIKSIRPDIKSGCFFVDMNPIGHDTFSQVSEVLPDPKAFIAWVPALNPKYLAEGDSGPESAREDLFQHSHVYIAGDFQTHPEALKLGNDLAKLAGSLPLNIEPQELAGILALSHDFPSLVAAVATRLTTSESGWNEARKLAGFEFNQLSGILSALENQIAPEARFFANRHNLQRLLALMIEELQIIHACLDEDQAADFTDAINNAILARQLWQKQRTTMSWFEYGQIKPEAPQSMTERLLGKRRKSS
jgi:prephenate dehydrogenase